MEDLSMFPYEQRVQILIGARYTIADELAIQRQRDTKPEEFRAYYDFVEECKERAKGDDMNGG